MTHSTLLGCVLDAANAAQLAPQILIAIMAVEAGSSGVASSNTNGTKDLGVMQINTGAWLDRVANAHFAGDRERAYVKLRDDSCYNIQVGAWILSSAIAEAKGNVWEGVGRYHSRTPRHKKRYQARVKRAYQQLFGATPARGKSASSVTDEA